MNTTSNRSDSNVDVGSDQATILLVDDDPINLQVLYETLADQGHRLFIARSGEDALRIARQVRPEVILLDIMMPGMDGYDTCIQLKADNETYDAAVIFLTALTDTKEKVHGLSLGAVDFITKPFDNEEIIARVNRHLQLYRKQMALHAEIERLTSQVEAKALPESKARTAWLGSLIESGENDRLEFKSTIRWNLKTDKPDKGIEIAWLKSIVAFLNSEGGVLLVGIDDTGDIVGIDHDKLENEDRYLLYVNNKIQQHIGLEHARSIRFNLEPIGGAKVLVVECVPTSSPVFLREGKNESFFIRVGPGTRKLSISEVLAYVTARQSKTL